MAQHVLEVKLIETEPVRAIVRAALDVCAVADDLEPDGVPADLRPAIDALRASFRLEALKPPKVRRAAR